MKSTGNMDRKSLIKLVRRFLRGEASPEESRFLEEYDNRFDREQLPVMQQEREADIEIELFNRIHAQIGGQKSKPLGLRQNLIRFGVAASVILLAGISWTFYSGRLHFNESPEQISIKVNPGKTQTVTLPDGTLVTINAGSTLTYPARFSSETRPVTLEGEAYFDVAHDAEKPFLVSTSHLTVQVLGTRFNVSSYAQNTENHVAVVSGKVSVVAHNEQKKSVVLFPQQQAVYQVQTSALRTESADSSDILSWQRDQLVFRNQRLDEVAKALERKYDIHLSVDKDIQGCRIYAKIGSGPSEKALKAIAMLLNARLEYQGNMISIKGKGCS